MATEMAGGERTASPAAQRPANAAACPYCAVLLDPPPERGRLCPRCRRPIVVRRVDGRRVLLTREAVDVFESERHREAMEHAWTGERRRWLVLAKGVSAPAGRVARLTAQPPSQAVVEASKDLYLAGAERAVRAARRDKRWDVVARIRREQAAALYREAGTAAPPSEEIVELHRAWSEAALRSLVKYGAQVELVAAGCCAICGRDNGRAFRIATELRARRLPHEGCPKGLCACDWYPVPDGPVRVRRAARRAAPRPEPERASADSTADQGSPPPADAEVPPSGNLMRAQAADRPFELVGEPPEGAGTR